METGVFLTGKSGIKHQKLISGDHGDRGSVVNGG